MGFTTLTRFLALAYSDSVRPRELIPPPKSTMSLTEGRAGRVFFSGRVLVEEALVPAPEPAWELVVGVPELLAELGAVTGCEPVETGWLRAKMGRDKKRREKKACRSKLGFYYPAAISLGSATCDFFEDAMELGVAPKAGFEGSLEDFFFPAVSVN